MRIDNENKVVWCSEQLIDWKNSFSRYDDPVVQIMYPLARVGFGWNLTDAEEKVVDYKFWDKTQRKELMLAILEGYEFKLEQPQKYRWRKKEEHLAWFEEEVYLTKLKFDNENCCYILVSKNPSLKFTENEARNILKDDFDKFEKVECSNDRS